MVNVVIEKEDFYQAIRLSLKSDQDSLRLFLAKLIKKYGKSDQDFVEKINSLLSDSKVTRSSSLRKLSTDIINEIEDKSNIPPGLELIDVKSSPQPILDERTALTLNNVILERNKAPLLNEKGLTPTKSCIFVGDPGVGKSMSALWIAKQLNLPLYRIDLALIISSLLGKSGVNLKEVFAFAKKAPCILFLDEVDAIGKSRSDSSDVGELKRLVTVALQEIDKWPETGLLLAATNHPELIDRALWRRFDIVIQFEKPKQKALETILEDFSGEDLPLIKKWHPVFSILFEDKSYNDIQRSINFFRKGMLLNPSTELELIQTLISQNFDLSHKNSRISIALNLLKVNILSQHQISKITGVSRDTLRKHLKQESALRGDTK